jgi:hypothetical protein
VIPRDRSLLYPAPVPAWRREGRIACVAVLTERGHVRDICETDADAYGSTNAERVWSRAENVLRDALEGAWLGSVRGVGRAVGLRYVGPVEGDDRADWIDLSADLGALASIYELLGFLTGEDYWPSAPQLVGGAS